MDVKPARSTRKRTTSTNSRMAAIDNTPNASRQIDPRPSAQGVWSLRQGDQGCTGLVCRITPHPFARIRRDRQQLAHRPKGMGSLGRIFGPASAGMVRATPASSLVRTWELTHPSPILKAGSQGVLCAGRRSTEMKITNELLGGMPTMANRPRGGAFGPALGIAAPQSQQRVRPGVGR
jgi:hypothetical protein